MRFRNYIYWIFLICLLIWGPVNDNWPAWYLIRIGYIILIPLALWFILKWLWDYWMPSLRTEMILEKILFGCISAGLLLWAFFEAFSDYHYENTMWINTEDGREAVGEDGLVQGPNWFAFSILVFFASMLIWYGIIKYKKTKSE